LTGSNGYPYSNLNMEGFQKPESFNQNGVLGELTGRSEHELEVFFRRQVQEARRQLEQAREEADREGRIIRFEAAAVCGTNGGDWWVVGSGAVRRELERYPDAEKIILGGAPVTEPCPSLSEARPLLMRCAYNGLWSPSGTNWQPVRCVELTADEMERLGAGNSCGLLVLARARYQSILGDIASLAGREPSAGAEYIDPGIWLEAARLSARGHGWELEEMELARENEPRLKKLVELLRLREKGPAGELAAQLINQLLSGELAPVALLAVRRGPPLLRDERAPAGLALSAIDRLVESRSTQRLASPQGDLDKSLLQEMFSLCRRGAEKMPAVELSIHHWKEEVPRRVGEGMHQALEEEGGLISSLNLESLRRYLARQGGLPPELAAWASGQRGEEAADRVELVPSCLPRHLLSRLCADGGYRQERGRLLDRRGRPLTVQRLCRLTQLVARGFGKFFLSFQNTHPRLGIMLLAETNGRSLQGLGRLVERLTLLARARGLVSIIKSGPLELAGEKIRGILDEVGAPAGRAALTFQLGLPLGPEEKVCAGTPSEHDGLQERLLDRRAGRARLAEHYLPAPEAH
jgi:hypothetical protein